MQIIGGPQYNPGNGDGSFSAGPASIGGQIILHNLSPYDLLLTFNNDPTRQALLHAWQPRQFDFCGKQTLTVGYSVPVAPTTSAVQQAPTSYIWGESFMPNEPIPVSMPNYDRLSNVGNTVTTQGGSANVKNDNNSPGTQVIEFTPSDQTQSSGSINNDASGFLQILSAGILRTIWSFVRGNNATTKASAVLGDVGDPSIMTFYGVIGAGSSVPASVISGTLPGSQVGTGVAAANVAPGNFPAGTFGITANAAVGGFGLTINTPSVTGAHGDAMQITNGVDTTSSVTIGVGDAVQSPFGQGLYIYDHHGNGMVVQNINSTLWKFVAGLTVAWGAHGAQLVDNQGGSIELGAGNNVNPGAAITPFIDFHSSANPRDYDSRIMASGGGASDGLGGLTFYTGVAGLVNQIGGVNYQIAIMKSAGGGGAGSSIWEGTTDPGAAAGEGDLWTGA